MRQPIPALLALVPIAIASQNVFSVHDDLLAFPQYEVIFSDTFISESDAELIVEQSSSAIHDVPNTKSLESHNHAQSTPPSSLPYAFDPTKETYELMYLNDEKHLCTIPIVNIPARNETSEKLARAAEVKELARATDRGWELLQELDGKCLYFQNGWWSYSFCYNRAITQFHQLPPQPGKLQIPQRDMTTKQFVLGKAIGAKQGDNDDEWETGVATRNGKQSHEPPKTELQVKGDTRYLVQKMEGGTTCDLTGKPRRIEVQFHCNPHLDDRIGYIKEVTTCSYLMVVYTPRLCNDIAFVPPKPEKANTITCRAIVFDAEEVEYRTELATLEASLVGSPKEAPLMVGGLVVGVGKWASKDGARMPIPAGFGKEEMSIDLKGMMKKIIAKAASKDKGGQVEMMEDKELRKLDIDPDDLEQLKEEIQAMAKEKGWTIEVVDQPGEVRQFFGVVDAEDEKTGKDKTEMDKKAEGEDEGEGSEEIFYKDEL